MDKDQIIEKLKAGHELYNRGAGWWLMAKAGRAGGMDSMQIDDNLMNKLERDGSLKIVMLTRSMRAELP